MKVQNTSNKKQLFLNLCYIKDTGVKTQLAYEQFLDQLSRKNKNKYKEQVEDPYDIHTKFDKNSYPQNKRLIVFHDLNDYDRIIYEVL